MQFIGGEPTAHPDFDRLLRHAIAAGLKVEVFSNLVAIRDTLWGLFTYPKVSLATSYSSGYAASARVPRPSRPSMNCAGTADAGWPP